MQIKDENDQISSSTDIVLINYYGAVNIFLSKIKNVFIGKSLINFLFQINLTVPHLIGAIGILYLFSQSGSFARLAFQWGIITRPSEFPELVFDPYAIGIILQYQHS